MQEFFNLNCISDRYCNKKGGKTGVFKFLQGDRIESHTYSIPCSLSIYKLITRWSPGFQYFYPLQPHKFIPLKFQSLPTNIFLLQDKKEEQSSPAFKFPPPDRTATGSCHAPTARLSNTKNHLCNQCRPGSHRSKNACCRSVSDSCRNSHRISQTMLSQNAFVRFYHCSNTTPRWRICCPCWCVALYRGPNCWWMGTWTERLSHSHRLPRVLVCEYTPSCRSPRKLMCCIYRLHFRFPTCLLMLLS